VQGDRPDLFNILHVPTGLFASVAGPPVLVSDARAFLKCGSHTITDLLLNSIGGYSHHCSRPFRLVGISARWPPWRRPQAQGVCPINLWPMEMSSFMHIIDNSKYPCPRRRPAESLLVCPRCIGWQLCSSCFPVVINSAQY